MNKSGNMPFAYIKHELPGRVRLKIPEKRGNFDYFDHLAEVLTGCLHITQLQLNPPAASLLICYAGGASPAGIADFAEANGLFRLTEMPEQANPFPAGSIVSLSSSGVFRFDKLMQEFSRGRLDIRSMLFLTILGMAFHQIAKGNIMAPAASLLWYAFEIMNKAREKQVFQEKEDVADSGPVNGSANWGAEPVSD